MSSTDAISILEQELNDAEEFLLEAAKDVAELDETRAKALLLLDTRRADAERVRRALAAIKGEPLEVDSPQAIEPMALEPVVSNESQISESSPTPTQQPSTAFVDPLSRMPCGACQEVGTLVRTTKTIKGNPTPLIQCTDCGHEVLSGF